VNTLSESIKHFPPASVSLGTLTLPVDFDQSHVVVSAQRPENLSAFHEEVE
jgi:hypothetical protein